ncbi:MAG: hypothetical protein ACTSUE_09255, partial [Promethearchaeota archaeon]
ENIEVEKAKKLQFTLFGERIITPDKIPKKFAYKFYCQDENCNCNMNKRPHDMICEDFELLESFRQWRMKYKDFKELETKLIERYGDFMKKKRELYFIVGTTHLFGTWVIIGLYYPPKEKKQKENLFGHLTRLFKGMKRGILFPRGSYLIPAGGTIARLLRSTSPAPDVHIVYGLPLSARRANVQLCP